jgi:F420-dependent oxidoreductase-like protein
MRIGLGAGPLSGGPADLQGQVADVVRAEEDGFTSVWFNSSNGVDPLTTIALAGGRTRRIELVTGVLPIYSRQPLLMAQQALSASEATGGRFTLGIGLAHPESVPLMWNSAFDRPAKFMAEYLGALLPLLEEKQVQTAGEMIITEASLNFPDVPAPGVLLAALGPRMLRLAGRTTGGTVLWVTGPNAIRSHIAPRLREAADDAGRDAPRIYTALPITVTDDRDAARRATARQLRSYGRLVNYRRVLDIEGVDGPEDVALIGNEAEVEAQLRELAEAGATDFAAAITTVARGDTETVPRTRALLKSLIGKI